MTGYRRGGAYSRRREVIPGRVRKPNRRPDACRACGVEVPAGAGQLWRETSGAWSVVHLESAQGGWLMHPEPVRGGCPDETDRRNAELHASGFLGPDAALPASEHERIAALAARYVPEPERVPASTGAGYRELSRRLGPGYAVLSSGAVVRASSQRCEDAPCCGCC